MPFEEQPLFTGNELYRINQLLAEEGVTIRMLLTGTGLAETVLKDPEILLSWRQFDIIYRNAFRLSSRPDIGLLIGNCLDLSRWGELGNAMSSCRDIDHALGMARHYRELVRCPFDFPVKHLADGLHVSLVRHSGIEYAVNQMFASEIILMGIVAVIEDLLGDTFQFREVFLSYDPPPYKSAYEQLLKCPVHFNAVETAYVIDKAVLTRPLPHANPINYGIARKHCNDHLLQIRASRQQDLTYMVLNHLASREGSNVELSEMAASLGMNARTLRRKLSEQGTSYRDLVNQDRKRRSMEYLQNSVMDIDTIALMAGFSDTPSFRKAFKRWTGMSPRDFRQTHSPSSQPSPASMVL